MCLGLLLREPPSTRVVWPAKHQWEERGLVLWATVAVRMTRKMGVIVIMGDI